MTKIKPVEISYSKYRDRMAELNYQKQKLLKTIELKKQAHAKYREYYKQYRKLDKKQEELTNIIIDKIPRV